MNKILIFILTFISVNMYSQKGISDIIKGNEEYIEKNYFGALENYQKALTKNKESYTALFNSGNALYRLKRFDEAIKNYHLSTAFTKNKIELSNSFFNIGDAYMMKNDYKKAEEFFKKALKLNPNSEMARYNYALAKKKQNEEQKEKKKQNENEDKDEDKKGKEESDNKEKDKPEKKANENKGKIPETPKPISEENEGDDKQNIPKELYEQTLKKIQLQERKTLQRIINENAKHTKDNREKDW